MGGASYVGALDDGDLGKLDGLHGGELGEELDEILHSDAEWGGGKNEEQLRRHCCFLELLTEFLLKRSARTHPFLHFSPPFKTRQEVLLQASARSKATSRRSYGPRIKNGEG
jgi:hypothetical protein